MTKIKINKAYYAISNDEKLPRKTKKAILGKRIGRCKLKALLKSVEVIKPANTMYETAEIKPYLFCPHCGCCGFHGTGNRTSYPEHWEYFKCDRCHKVVAYIDNSPFIHALECAHDNYNPVF